ncbi:MAG: sulfotransferase [Calditrichaeota bacterium]|nr:MAG: sulfotransferase [Calditrichota bacterium]
MIDIEKHLPAESQTELEPRVVSAVRQPVIIIGMHRSGTTLVTKILSRLGVQVGRELDGHMEAVCFQNINKALLASADADWTTPRRFVTKVSDPDFVERGAELATRLWLATQASFGPIPEESCWAWKDPRNTLTLPIWLRLFPQAKVIHMVRNGVDVALSLHRREMRNLFLQFKTSPEKRTKVLFPPTIAQGFRLWQAYVETGMHLHQQSKSSLLVRYEDLLAHPVQILKLMAAFIELPVSSGEIQSAAETIIGRPTPRSRFDRLRLRLLFASGILDTKLLTALGYERAR